MTPFEHDPNATMTTQRALTSSSSSAASNEDSEESYIDSLEEGRAPLLGDDDEGPLPSYNESRDDCQDQERSEKKLNYSSYRFPRERHKALVAICLLFMAAVSNDLVLSYIHEKVPEGKPLPDFVFANTPYIPQALIVSEYLMLSSFAALIILTLLHKYRWIVLRRIATIGSLLYFGRCLTMFVTQVPIADANYYSRALKIVSGVGLKINGKHTLCGDYIYSGHTIVLVVCYLFIRESVPTLTNNISVVNTTKEILNEVHSLSPLLHSTITTAVDSLKSKVDDIKSYSAQDFISKLKGRFESTILPLDKWIQAKDIDLTVIYAFISGTQLDFDSLSQSDIDRLKVQFPALVNVLSITKIIESHIVKFAHTPIHAIIDLF
ncbi:hypothetical protein FO519_005512 [Halicephalobus sp. NKZ332]|nr:hypothetical protein FO519_005512 [Halicephalobus sp. NKZ332]